MQISVQLQLQPQEGHSAEAMTSTKTMDQCQVSFSESDESSVNLDELVNTAECDVESDVSDRVFHKFENSSVHNTDTLVQSSQEAINQAMLMQLASIGKCLDFIEKTKVCKKSVDSSKIKSKSKSLRVSNARRRTVETVPRQTTIRSICHISEYIEAR